MPLKKNKSNKRFHSSDSDDSVDFQTPKKPSNKRLNRPVLDQEEEEQLEDMVNANSSNNFDVRLSNGRVNGISMETTNYGMSSNLNNSGLNPVVTLNRDVVETALKRKSLGLVVVPTATPINENEEIEERRKRQNNRAVAQRRSLLNLNNGTPSRRSAIGSTAVVMSGIQLREHYTHCIQLSASNKINTKNAFGLYLIDYMSELIKEKQSQTNGFVNFKLAGSALDAGAKIYCHRVDSVHAEAQKVASSLVMALDNKNGSNNNEDLAANNDNNDEINDENNEQNNEDENNAKTKKRKTTKRNIKTLAQNIETLNVNKIEANLEIDPVFHHLSSAFDVGNVNSLLMANLKINPSGMLLLDSNSSLNFDNSHITCQSTMQSISNLYNQLEEISKSSSQICPKLSSFEFLNRECGLDFIPREEDPSFVRRNSFNFDLNAEVEDVDDMDCEDMGGGDVFDADDMNDDAASDDAGPEAPETVKKSLFRSVNMSGVGDLVKMLSDKPNDYSYFNPKLLSTWAGPHHWKRIPFLHKKDRVDGETGKSRRQRKQYTEHNYSTIELDEDFNKTGSSELKLKLATLQKWQKDHNDLQLPADHGFDPKHLAQSFIKPDYTFQCAKSHEEVLDATINSNNDSFGVANSPGMDRYDYDDDDINTAGFTDPLELAQSAPVSLLNPNTGDTFPFVGDNLVEQPYDIQQYNITFAKFAKKMDVKKLKRAMWDVITISPEPATPMTPEQTLTRKLPSNLNFTDLYQNLPKKITPIMATNLSAPIAFVTLLHLCNERNLKLIGREDLEDFSIEQEI